MPHCLRFPSLFDPEDYKRRREVELKHGRVRDPGKMGIEILPLFWACLRRDTQNHLKMVQFSRKPIDSE